jgi:hypothetical protein
MRIFGDLYRELLLLVKNIITKIPRRYIVAAIVLSIVMMPICYQFFMPKILPVVPPAITPESAVRVHPPPDETLIPGAATAAIWTVEVFLIPDMSAEEVISFYEEQFFRCEPTDFNIYPALLSNPRWRCMRGRHAQHFIVWIRDSDENGTQILVEVIINPLS